MINALFFDIKRMVFMQAKICKAKICKNMQAKKIFCTITSDIMVGNFIVLQKYVCTCEKKKELCLWRGGKKSY